MKVERSVMVINGVLLGIGLILLIRSGMNSTSIGLLAILMAFINFILVFIFLAQRKRNAMLNALILTGVLFTIGFSICSNTLNLH